MVALLGWASVPHRTTIVQRYKALYAVETTAISESDVLTQLQPQTLATDNSYTQVTRIKRWAKQGVVLLTPALKWVKGRSA
jgi:hypothetical protein